MAAMLPFGVRDDGLVPKERYTSRAFLDLEMERLWGRVWQIACREELAAVGDFVEYAIGDQSILVVRAAPGEVAAFHNACLHRGTRLASGCGHFDGERIQCPYHAWRYALDGRLATVVDREDFAAMPEGMRLGPVRAECWGGFVFVSLDPHAEPLLEFLDPLPALLAPYRLHEMRFRSYLSTVLAANWKTVVDAFNESYHVQGAHAQILPWTDDTSIAYEQFRTHAHYGRLPTARRKLEPSHASAWRRWTSTKAPSGLRSSRASAARSSRRSARSWTSSARTPARRARCSRATRRGAWSCCARAGST
jgi:phenylpropionate dioxygenase-like ring-hydroxylating dioxygenase large terminal subunit